MLSQDVIVFHMNFTLVGERTQHILDCCGKSLIDTSIFYSGFRPICSTSLRIAVDLFSHVPFISNSLAIEKQ